MNSIYLEILQIRNFKRVSVAEAEFTKDGLTIIGGKNGHGKSTWLHAIQFLLGGKKYMPSNVHNTDANGATAVIRGTLSNGIEVERSGKSSTLKVRVPDGKGNQKTLDEFINEFALDISKFMRASDTDKAKMLIKHLGIGEKLEELDKKIKSCEAERTVSGRNEKQKKALADSLVTYDDAPEERVDVSALIQEERRLSEENQRHQVRLQETGRIAKEGKFKIAEIERLQEQIDKLKADAGEMRDRYNKLKEVCDEFTPHDLTPITDKINNADSLNKMVEANQKALAAQNEAKSASKEYQNLTDTINEAREQRQRFMSEMKMPLYELEINDGELFYQGNKWDCMSGSQKLKVATAISRAFKPECGFVLVDELEQMDWGTIQEFNEWAKSEQIQIIGAMVCDEDKASENVIMIEDGKIKGNG